MSIRILQTVAGNGSNGATSVSKAITVVAGSIIVATAAHGSAQSTSGVSDGAAFAAVASAVGTNVTFSTKLSPFVSGRRGAGTWTIVASFSAGTTYPSLILSEIADAAELQTEPGNAAYDGTPSVVGADGILTGAATLANQPALMYSIMYGGATCGPGSNLDFDTFGTILGSNSGYNQTWNTASKRVVSTGSKQGFWTNSDSADSILALMLLIDEGLSVEEQLERGLGRGYARGQR